MVFVDQQRIFPVSGSIAASGSTAILDAPGEGQCIAIAGYTIQSLADGEQQLLIKSGTVTVARLLLVKKGDGAVFWVPDGYVWLVGENEPVHIDASANISFAYTVWWYRA